MQILLTYPKLDDMQRKLFTLVTILFLGTCQWVLAQTMAVKPGTNFNNSLIEAVQLQSFISEQEGGDWTLYADEENKLYYIDFEMLNVNLSDIVVKNQAGEVLLQDNVFDLPVNTIYELDFSKYQPGNYEIELRTFTGAICKKISLK